MWLPDSLVCFTTALRSDRSATSVTPILNIRNVVAIDIVIILKIIKNNRPICRKWRTLWKNRFVMYVLRVWTINIENEYRQNFKYRLVPFVARCFRCRWHGFATYSLPAPIATVKRTFRRLRSNETIYVFGICCVFLKHARKVRGCNRAESFSMKPPSPIVPTYYIPRRRHAKRIAYTRLICFPSKYLFIKTLETAVRVTRTSNWNPYPFRRSRDRQLYTVRKKFLINLQSNDML